jgi:hypothetical protein
MKEYGQSFDQVMALTPRRFWALSNQIDRLRAETDLRQIRLLASHQSAEAYKMATEHLTSQVGQVYVWRKDVVSNKIVIDPDTGEEMDPEFDREGLRALKQKLAAR